MQVKNIVIFMLVSLIMFACSWSKIEAPESVEYIHQSAATENLQEIFYKDTMNASPFLPSDLSLSNDYSPPVTSINNVKQYLTSNEVDYSQYAWEQRISHDWSYFSIPKEHGKVLIIDIKQTNGQPAYRYLANAHSQNQRYEPWSSSKIFAYTGAMAYLRKTYPRQGETYVGKIGDHYIADLITSINSYEPFGLADGNSNAIATFFANLAGREYLTFLFYDGWLKLSTPDISFRGAYGPSTFEPNAYTWSELDNSQLQTLNMNNIASEDPSYLSYRCEKCGLTGNKPMTTLAQAEWLKRLAMHTLDSATSHPHLLQIDVDTLFYGLGHSQNPNEFAGMTLGISTMLQRAIVKALEKDNSRKEINPKQLLDEVSGGKWRVFQKIGAGPSETRSTSENVVLAFVHLPSIDPSFQSRSFVIAAQVSVPEAKEENVALAGIKMQSLLDSAMIEYFRLD